MSRCLIIFVIGPLLFVLFDLPITSGAESHRLPGMDEAVLLWMTLSVPTSSWTS
jgi:hypothetical protein